MSEVNYIITHTSRRYFHSTASQSILCSCRFSLRSMLILASYISNFQWSFHYLMHLNSYFAFDFIFCQKLYICLIFTAAAEWGKMTRYICMFQKRKLGNIDKIDFIFQIYEECKMASYGNLENRYILSLFILYSTYQA